MSSQLAPPVTSTSPSLSLSPSPSPETVSTPTVGPSMSRSATMSTLRSADQEGDLQSPDRTVVDLTAQANGSEKLPKTNGSSADALAKAEAQKQGPRGAEIKLSQTRKWFLLFVFSVAQVCNPLLRCQFMLMKVPVPGRAIIQWTLRLHRRHPHRSRYPVRVFILDHRKSSSFNIHSSGAKLRSRPPTRSPSPQVSSSGAVSPTYIRPSLSSHGASSLWASPTSSSLS